MKNLLILILVILSVQSSAQVGDIGTHFIVGYGAGTNSFSNAYVTNVSIGSMPLDLTSLEFQKDRFNHSSFILKASRWDDGFFIDSDVSYLSSIIGEGLRSVIKGNGFKKTNTSSTGQLKKIDENTRDDAEGLGKQADIIRVEFGVGDGGYYLGGVWGFGSWGIEDLSGTGSPSLANSDVYVNATASTTHTIGLSFTKDFEHKIGIGMLSTQINTVAMRYKGNDELKRRGIESKTILKLYTSQNPGLYVDAFYRFQRFKKFERPGNWSNNYNGENGTVPKIITHAIGVNVGFYFSTN